MKLQARFREERVPPGPALRQPEQAVAGRARERAVLEIEAAHAEIVLIVVVLLKRRAQRVRFRHRVIETAVHVHPIGRPADRGAPRAVGQRGVHVRGVVERRAAGRQRERRPLFQKRSAEIERVLLRLLRSFLRLKRVARVERAVPEREVHAAAHRPEAWLRRDVHERHAAAVVLGGEHAAREADRSDLRFRWKLASAESVHANRRARSRHLPQHLLHFVRVVGERGDLVLREHVAEALAVRIGGGGRGIAADRHALVHALDRERDLATVVAALDAHVSNGAGLEARKAHLDRVMARDEIPRRRDSLAVGDEIGTQDGRVHGVGAGQTNGRARDHRPAGILHDDPQRARGPRLRRCGRRQHEAGKQKQENDGSSHGVSPVSLRPRTSSDRSSG